MLKTEKLVLEKKGVSLDGVDFYFDEDVIGSVKDYLIEYGKSKGLNIMLRNYEFIRFKINIR